MAWLLCLYLLLLTPVVSIRVLPSALLANAPLRITCSVPHRPENRKLVIAVEGYWTSEYELEGEAAPAIFQKIYEHVPCGVNAVSCSLTEVGGKVTRAALPIQVSGCDER
jgi:hypothetical protein